MDIAEPNRLMLGYTRTMMEFLMFHSDPRHVGMIGLGGGSLQKYCYHHLPKTKITVAEISPEVIALRDRFCIPKDNKRLRILCEDGAEFVARHREAFDVLLVDGFDGSGQPAELCSQEFYDHCYGSLAEDGLLVVNICDNARSMLVARLRRTFRNRVAVVNGEDSNNTIAFADKGTRLSPQPARPHKRAADAML